MVMLVSAVVITRNEAPRLRLVLDSLEGQRLEGGVAGSALELEVVVVDDASTDVTPEVLDQAAERLRLRVVRHAACRGRSPSRNAGVRAASGDVVVLFDGDCLASPDLVRRHAELHASNVRAMGRGETFHIRSTRFFYDPETGSPMPGAEEHVARMGEEVARAVISREQVRLRFSDVMARGEPGIYAGAGIRRLYELEMRALQAIPEGSVLWLTAPGQNFSIRRSEFDAVGGFDERLSLNEHRELAFRLCERGMQMVAVPARSFHMLHRVGWRDPLDDGEWERIFYRAHPCLATRLMRFFWLTVARDKELPEEARIESLEELDSIVKRGPSFDYDGLRGRHSKLPVLPNVSAAT
jgi:glycosyltransferase involved in cell wall biosynthesis